MFRNEIEKDAKFIWQYLNIKRENYVNELKIKDREPYLAIVWLAREGTISFYEKRKMQFVFLVN